LKVDLTQSVHDQICSGGSNFKFPEYIW